MAQEMATPNPVPYNHARQTEIEIQVEKLTGYPEIAEYQIHAAREHVPRGQDDDRKRKPVNPRTLEQEIQRAVRENMAFCNAYLWFSASSKGNSNFPVFLKLKTLSPEEQDIDDSNKKMEDDGDNTHTYPRRVFSSGKPVSWMGLNTFIRETSPRLTGSRGYRQQSVWWEHTGKIFNFPELAVELQEMVLFHALGHGHIYPLSTISRGHANRWIMYDLRPYLKSDLRPAKVVLGFGQNMREYEHHKSNHLYSNACLPGTLRRITNNEMYVYPTRVGLDPETPAPNLALLRVNKHIHQLATHLAWERSWKNFSDPNVFLTAINAGRQPRYNWLNKVELSFTNKGYFSFVGIRVDWVTLRRCPDYDNATAANARQLREDLTGLEKLVLRFERPRGDGTYYGSPWARCRPRPLPGCQRKVVHWIMTFLFPEIKQIPRVTLKGDVRTATKQYWESGLAELREGRGHLRPEVYDSAAEMNAILSKSRADLPPRCDCNRYLECQVDTRPIYNPHPGEGGTWPEGLARSDWVADDTPYVEDPR